jgi:agmatinase
MSWLFGGYNLDLGVDVFQTLRVVDFGDVDVVPGNAVETYRRVEDRVRRIVAAGAAPFMMGGDHGVTLPVVRAVSAASERRVGLVVFDTHLDLAESLDGDRFTRASPMRRIAEIPQVDPHAMVMIGVRGPRNPVEWVSIARELGITYYTMGAIEDRGIDAVCEEAAALVRERADALYISVDIDAVDPAVAPGTNSPEPCGLTSRELIRGLRVVMRDGFIGLDIVEVAPDFDTAGGTTSLLAARVLAEGLGGLASRSRS